MVAEICATHAETIWWYYNLTHSPCLTVKKAAIAIALHGGQKEAQFPF